MEVNKMEREVKVTITEVTVPMKIQIGSHRRIHPDYGFLGIESKNVTVVEFIYFKDMDFNSKTEIFRGL
jgi:hypothetical protein